MTSTRSFVVTLSSVNLPTASALIAAARDSAAAFGIEVAIAVSDVGGHLRAFESMDGTPFFSHDIAINKAWTAAAFRMPTHVWSDALRDPAVAQLAHAPRLVAVAGGLPISEDGVVIGGIGVSGGSAEQDRRIAEAALRSAGFALPD